MCWKARTGRPLSFRFSGRLQEFRENLVDDRVLVHKNSHASSSHESSLEPTLARSADLGKHSVFFSLPERPKLRDLPEDLNHKGTVQKTHWPSRISCRILVTWLQQITKFSVKFVNLETIIDMQSWCRTWLPTGSSNIRAKQKLLRKHKGACKSSWSQIGHLKSFTLTIPWNLAKFVKIFFGSFVRRHHTDQKQMGLPKEQCAEWKKAPLLYFCNRV